VALPPTRRHSSRGRTSPFLRIKRIQAANTQIRQPLTLQKREPRPKREGFYRPQRGQLFIAIALLPVKLRPLRLMAAPQKRIKSIIQRKGNIENSRAGRGGKSSDRQSRKRSSAVETDSTQTSTVVKPTDYTGYWRK
jgi:hypothetical protein